MMKDLWISIFHTSFSKIYNILLGIVSLIITARLLGPEGRGVLAAVISWTALLATFSSLSLGQVSQYYIQTQKKDNWFPALFGSLVFLASALFIVVSIIVVIIYLLTEGKVFGDIKASLLLFGLLMLPFSIWELYGSYLLMSIGKLKLYNIAQITGRTVNLLTIVLLVYVVGLGVEGALFGTVLGQIIISLIGIRQLWKTAGSKLIIEKSIIYSLLKGAGELHLNTVGAFLLSQVNIILLNYYSTKAAVGWYQFSFQLISVMLVLPQAVSMVFFSKMAGLTPDLLWKSQKKIIIQIMAVMLIMMAMAYCVSPKIIILLAGRSFYSSIVVFQQLLPVVIGMSLAQLMATQWIGRGKFVIASILTITAAIINILIGIIFIPKFGMQGAIWASLLTLALFTTVAQVIFAFFCTKSGRQMQRI